MYIHIMCTMIDICLTEHDVQLVCVNVAWRNQLQASIPSTKQVSHLDNQACKISLFPSIISTSRQ